MTARLLMIAHAETTATRRAAFPAGEGLDARGRDAAAAFAVPRHDLAFASPAPAARETAAVLALAAQELAALDDLDVGTWAGRSLADVAAADPVGAEAFLADPTFAGHGGESLAALIARVGACLDTWREHSGSLVAVSHAAVLRAAVLAVLGAPASAFWRIDVPPLGALAFTSDGRRWALRAR
jgi:broad specificity phosphatase PhoE